jgi:hypothetical protein
MEKMETKNYADFVVFKKLTLPKNDLNFSGV